MTTAAPVAPGNAAAPPSVSIIEVVDQRHQQRDHHDALEQGDGPGGQLLDRDRDPQPGGDADEGQEHRRPRRRQGLELGRHVEGREPRRPHDEIGRHRPEDRSQPHHPGPRPCRRQSGSQPFNAPPRRTRPAGARPRPAGRPSVRSFSAGRSFGSIARAAAPSAAERASGGRSRGTADEGRRTVHSSRARCPIAMIGDAVGDEAGAADGVAHGGEVQAMAGLDGDDDASVGGSDLDAGNVIQAVQSTLQSQGARGDTTARPPTVTVTMPGSLGDCRPASALVDGRQSSSAASANGNAEGEVDPTSRGRLRIADSIRLPPGWVAPSPRRFGNDTGRRAPAGMGRGQEGLPAP